MTEPPAPPPKPSTSRGAVLHGGEGSVRGPGPRPAPARHDDDRVALLQRAKTVDDPGNDWLPMVLQHKSKQDIADLLADPPLMAAFSASALTAPPSMMAAQVVLREATEENRQLAAHLAEVETRLGDFRASVQAQLLSMHALERQWRQKQAEMDRALAPVAPSSLYQRLAHGVQEQELVCRALEESFLDGDGDQAAEREVAEWLRRYREAKKIYYHRREQRERWDEGRVGGWR